MEISLQLLALHDAQGDSQQTRPLLNMSSCSISMSSSRAVLLVFISLGTWRLVTEAGARLLQAHKRRRRHLRRRKLGLVDRDQVRGAVFVGR